MEPPFWKQIQYYENGDSAITLGAGMTNGPQNYVKSLGENIKNSGITDGKTGNFKDTLKIYNASGKVISEEYCEGLLNPITGIGEFDYTISRPGKKISSHFKVSTNASSVLQIQKTGDVESPLISFSGDTIAAASTSNGVKNVFTGLSQGEGVYQINFSASASSTGTQINKGNFKFGQDGNGTGSLIQYELGKAKPESKVGFQNDGAIFLDGVKINK